MLGILRGKRVVRDEFAKPFGKGLNFCGATVLLDAKGATFDRIDNGGRDGDPDAISTAVPGSLAPVPWAQVPTAQLLLAMATAAGEPFFADPRQVLRHADAAAAEDGPDRGRRDRARVLPARSRRRAARRRKRRPHSRARAARRTDRSTARWRTSRTSIPSSPSSTRPARRRTSRSARRSRNSRPASSRSTCITSRVRRLAADHAVLLKRAVKAIAQAPRHGRELHGEAVRGRRRLQPARAREPDGRFGTQRVREQGCGAADLG